MYNNLESICDNELYEAKKLWESALVRFDNAETSEMTELAIYDIAAAQRRFMVVLSKHKA